MQTRLENGEVEIISSNIFLNFEFFFRQSDMLNSILDLVRIYKIMTRSCFSSFTYRFAKIY